MYKTYRTFVLSFATLVLMTTAAFGQNTIKSDLIFPESTQAFFAIADSNDLRVQWQSTELNRLLADEAFGPFRETFQAELEDAWTTRFGMSLDDITAISSGEVAGGLIAFPGKKPGYALMVETVGKKEQVNSFLVKRIKQVTNIRNGKAETERLMIGNTPVDATVLSVPATETEPARTAWYVNLPSLLLITDDRFGTEQLLLQIAGQTQNSLAGLPAYKATLERCMKDLPAGLVPHVRFYINPLEAGQAVRSLRNLSEKERSQPSTYEILAKQGFNGIRGIGGTFNVAQEGFESILRMKVYIPEEPQLAFKMLTFRNDETLAPPAWLGAEADRWTFLTIDTLNVFNNFGPLLDEFLETPGAWDDILASLEKDENGPKVNLKTDLIAWLGNRLAMEVVYTEPLGETSEKFVFALDIKPNAEQNIQDVLNRMFNTDPDFRKVDFQSNVIWQYARGAKPAKESSRRSSSRSRRNRSESEAAEGEQALITGGAFCVANGYFFVANDLEILQSVLTRLAAGQIESLSTLPLYNRFMEVVQARTQGAPRFAQGFNHSVKGNQLNYELYKQGKLSSGSTVFSRIVRALSDNQNKETSDKKVVVASDPSKLPPFEELADRMGYGGFYGQVEADGWFFTGLRFKAESANAAPAP
ncbi:MAG: hypothetical protein Q4G68_03800 [Planctomycetia bacterium]|nr:hypothetical protein [Planctomycetia bacterium]